LFGVFAQSRKYGIMDFIRVYDPGPNSWKYDKQPWRMVGQRSGCSTCLGQVMKVHIVSVNVSARLRNVVSL
jgi:hypothetical protein